MTITDDLRKEIEDDIAKCESYSEVKGSESLYGVLVAKYSVRDVNFGKNLSTNGKAAALGSEFDFRQELKAIAAKLRMWLLSAAVPNTKANTAVHVPKIMEELLSEDISRCEKYLADPSNETFGQNLYLEITSRYDNVIENFGNGLYSYFNEEHFYDPDISASTITHNLKLLLNKMISYQSQKYAELKSGRKKSQRILSNKIFIVHGHDEAAKEAMARTLEKGGFEAIILHEQANSGKTIIEKIETYTDVPFAVVLYTPCDFGRAKESNVESERYRARQNVVFEHGYLIGSLGRNSVCALVKGDVETPGDISGVVYIPMDDAGAWKAGLAKEMSAAGLPVDLNKLLK